MNKIAFYYLFLNYAVVQLQLNVTWFQYAEYFMPIFCIFLALYMNIVLDSWLI